MIYPGRPDHPQAEVVRKQMRAGSTLGRSRSGRSGRRLPFLNALELVRMTNNLGDAKSLVTHPATTTHQRLTPQARAELAITDGLVRFSAGLEASRRRGRGSPRRAGRGVNDRVIDQERGRPPATAVARVAASRWRWPGAWRRKRSSSRSCAAHRADRKDSNGIC